MDRRILLIDSYDSFTFNLQRQIERVTGAQVITIHNNSVKSAEDLVNNVLPLFDAVIVGPGPGHPAIETDIGIIPHLWTLKEQQLLPVLGVCLGMQSMTLAFGGQVDRLPQAQHGQPALIQHNNQDIFAGLPDSFPSIRYHSLQCHVDEGETSPLRVLATCKGSHGQESVLMAIKHESKPFYAVQYHPESVCSENGDQVISNFWSLALQWVERHDRSTVHDPTRIAAFGTHSVKPAPLADRENKTVFANDINNNENDQIFIEQVDYVDAPTICENLGHEFILLNSAAEPGSWSIVGVLIENETPWIRYVCGTESASVTKWARGQASEVADSNGEQIPLSGENRRAIWQFLSDYMEPKIGKFRKDMERQDIPSDIPFVGGLIGYFSYEAGVEALGEKVHSKLPDVNLVDIERCIVIDNKSKRAFVVSLRNDEWLDKMVDKVKAVSKNTRPDKTNVAFAASAADGSSPAAIHMPAESTYVEKIKSCKEFLASGDSYELCLTARTTIEMHDGRFDDPWDLYRLLLGKNPAPYSCFMKFPDSSVLVGSSPERFMSWSRDGVCEFRPIKGTVKKTGPETTREYAESILKTPKERGENLMIVDLIRHDLHQLIPQVHAKELMRVEEYKTVFQLVSVITGKLDENAGYKGIDILAQSLPPGSMTGAPKIRSVQLLHDLEDKQPRGIYSGVCGYWSVLDQGDWSVVIRSAFSYEPRVWNIGAGGAITILSDEHDEWDEMKTKLETALQAFV